MKKLILLFVCCSLMSYGQKKKSPSPDPAAAYDEYVQRTMKEWEIPGMAIVVVKDNKVLFKKGYGVRKINTADPVDTQTLFTCASTTKAMTATCLGMLVDEGKVKWDDPVEDYLPDFQLYDVYASRNLRVRDLLIHNSGVGNTDFLWTEMNVSSDEVLRKMRYVKPSYPFRGGYTYQNIFFLAAGKVIEKVSGQSWESFITERLFKPLNMIRTKPTLKDVLNDSNLAYPHDKIDGKVALINRMSADQIGPAGSVKSCVDDLANWVQCMIDSSKFGNIRLLKAETWVEIFKPQTILPSLFYPTMKILKPNWTTYGLGWFQHDYRGEKVNFHTGSLSGEIAINGQLPSQKLGIFIIANLDHAELRHALMYKAFDTFALGGNRDWSAEFKPLYQSIEAESQQKQKELANKRVSGTTPTLPLASFAGTYTDPLYGKVDVTLKNDKLEVNFNGFVHATLEHWHYDTFRAWYDAQEENKQISLLLFDKDPSGTLAGLRIGNQHFIREQK
ncbi:MAG: serine hydrolase [Siphonobacter sp.]